MSNILGLNCRERSPSEVRFLGRREGHSQERYRVVRPCQASSRARRCHRFKSAHTQAGVRPMSEATVRLIEIEHEMNNLARQLDAALNESKDHPGVDERDCSFRVRSRSSELSL